MKHETLHDFLTFVMRERVENDNPISPILWSYTGTGKTTGVKKFAKDNNLNLVTLHLSTQEPGDLIGIPVVDKETNTTVWGRPEWFPPENSEEGWVIFLDEFNRCHKMVMDIMLPFLLEGQIHTHKLPKNTLIVAAANPGGDENYSVTEIEDAALLSRLCHVRLDPNFASWKKYVDGKVHPAVIEVAKKSNMFSKRCPVPEIDHDPRSMEIAGAAIQNMSEEEWATFGFEFLQGMVGSIANAIKNEVNTKGLNKFPLTATEVLQSYGDKKSSKLVKKAGRGNTGALSELNSSLLTAISEMDRDLSGEEMQNVSNYLKDLPFELGMAMITSVLKAVGRHDENGVYLRFLELSRFLSKDQDILKIAKDVNATRKSKESS